MIDDRGCLSPQESIGSLGLTNARALTYLREFGEVLGIEPSSEEPFLMAFLLRSSAAFVMSFLEADTGC